MDIHNFIKTSKKTLIDEWLSQLDADYAVGKASIKDETYDMYVRFYEERFNKRTVVGAPPTRDAVKLPIAMMSLDKIMKEKELQNFMGKNPGPYVVMDKINGNSGLYEIKDGIAKLYNRGDGTEATDLSYILQYLNLPVLPFDIHVKGELVIDKKDYEPFKLDYKTNLSMVAGLLNSQSADPERLKLIRFVAFDLSYPKKQDSSLNMSQTLDQLVKYEFKIPFKEITPILSIDWLSKFFKQQKSQQVYDVDGMVIVDDRPVEYEERLIRENPKYAIAFKEYGDTHEAIVTHILWEASKHGVIKPVVKVNPIPVGNGFTIRSLTAFNAKWIMDNKVGPGSKLSVTHNTIPYILGVIQHTIPQMPPIDKFPEDSWKWNDTGVDIVLLQANDEVKIARIYEFFKQIGAKYWGENTLSKFYYSGYNTIKIMVETTREQFNAYPIEGVGSGIIDRMVRTRNESLPLATLAQLMAASGAFGLGLGKRKSQAIINVYPNILDINPTVEEISQINGFAQKTSERFVNELPKFKSFISNIPILDKVARGQMKPLIATSPDPIQHPIVQQSHVKNNGQTIQGKSVVFTGFRDSALESAITSGGGNVKTGVSKKTSYLLVGGSKGQGSGKENKAIKCGVPVLSVAEFKTMFRFK